ncbi:hypothetical protein Adt_34728 [Abeliophyllum distichum]|uniref:Uncharacterized protein n=1 Tax=Abeliophyllum distichum TaxID=126358 RepID=A0ABD1R159_9LAMI
MFPQKSYAVLFTSACKNLDLDTTIDVSFDSTTVDFLTATLLELDGPNIGLFIAVKNLDKCTKFYKGEEVCSFRCGVGIVGRGGICGGRIYAAARSGAMLVTRAKGRRGGGGEAEYRRSAYKSRSKDESSGY